MTDKPKTPAPPEPHDYKPCDSECNNKGCHHVRGHGDPCGLPATAFVHALVQPSPPAEEPAPALSRAAVIAMMEKRGWSLHWTHRGAYLHLEASELIEAVRGKGGSTLGESADVLLTLLGLSPHDLPEIVAAAGVKLADLMTRPTYVGEAKAEPPPAADPKPSWECDGSHRPPRCTSAECWMDGDEGIEEADESGATREPLCGKCGLTRGTLSHRPAEFSDDPGAEDCHRFVTGEFVEGEPQPGIEAGRGEECDHRWEEVTVMALVKSCSRCGLDEDEVKLHAAEERLVEQIQENQRLEKGTVALEEARGLAVQELERRRGPEYTYAGVNPIPRKAIEHRNAEVERLQGVIAGLREAAAPVLVYLDAVLKHDRPRDPRNERILLGLIVGLRAALAPQEGAEKGTKG